MLWVPAPTLVELSAIVATPVEVERLRQMCSSRLHNLVAARMVRKRMMQSAGIVLWERTPVPRVFCADPVFGASLGADPETFGRLHRTDVLQWLGPEVDYTPHNVDTAMGAVMLTVLVATWGEWAQALLDQSRSRAS